MGKSHTAVWPPEPSEEATIRLYGKNTIRPYTPSVTKIHFQNPRPETRPPEFETQPNFPNLFSTSMGSFSYKNIYRTTPRRGTLQIRRVMQITRFDPFTLHTTHTTSVLHQT